MPFNSVLVYCTAQSVYCVYRVWFSYVEHCSPPIIIQQEQYIRLLCLMAPARYVLCSKQISVWLRAGGHPLPIHHICRPCRSNPKYVMGLRLYLNRGLWIVRFENLHNVGSGWLANAYEKPPRNWPLIKIHFFGGGVYPRVSRCSLHPGRRNKMATTDSCYGKMATIVP